MLEQDGIDELDAGEHRITSNNNRFHPTAKTPDDFKSSLEGLSEREVRILVQDEFTPMTSHKHGDHQLFAMENNIQAGSGLASTTTSTPENPLKVHDGVIASMASKVPLAPMMSLNKAEQLIRETKVAATSGDLFFTAADDWAVGQNEKKQTGTVRSKSEPRNILNELNDENMLSGQKRDMVKKILRLQRQKFKDNQARKSRKSNEFENSIYGFSSISKNEDEQALLTE